MCKIIDGHSPRATKLSRAVAAASLYYNYSKTEKCFKLEDEDNDHGLQGWNWQVTSSTHRTEEVILVLMHARPNLSALVSMVFYCSVSKKLNSPDKSCACEGWTSGYMCWVGKCLMEY